MSGLISAQVTDELLERIDSVREGEPPDYDESRSATVRRLIRAGLDATDNQASTFTDRLTSALAAMLALGYPTLAAYAGRPITAAVWIAAVAGYLLFQPQVHRAVNQLPNPLN